MKPKDLVKNATKNLIKNLCAITLKGDVASGSLVNRVVNSLPNNAYVAFIKGVQSSTLVIPREFYPLASGILSNYVENYKCGVLALVLHLSSEAYTTPGVLAELLDYFKKRKINIIELFTSYLDVILLIDEEDQYRIKGILS